MSTLEQGGAQQARRRIGLLRLAFEQALTEIHGQLEASHPELRAAHLQVLRRGTIDGRRVTDLAAHAGMTKQSMHELVGHLERHGYLRREPDPSDTRARLVWLTERGRQLEGQMHEAVDCLLRNWCARLGHDRYEALWSSLQEITGYQPSMRIHDQ